MVVKRYYRLSWEFILMLILSLGMFGFDAFGCVAAWVHKFYIAGVRGIVVMIVLHVGLALFGCSLCDTIASMFYFGTIRLEQTQIYCSKEKNKLEEIVQHPTSAEYADIKEMYILPLNRDSNGKKKNFSRPLPYLCIKTSKRKITRFMLYGMRRKSVRNLLEELRRRCEESGNSITIDVDKMVNDYAEARWSVSEWR